MSNGEYNSDKTEREQKIDKIIELTEKTRPSLDEFKGLKNYRDQEIEADEAKAKVKKAQEKPLTQKEQEEARDNTALEGLIYHICNRGQFFNRETYTEPGSEYDDLFQGVDVIFGFPQGKGKKDIIFNVDVTTATSEPIIANKFYLTEIKSKPKTPGCNNIFYYAHDNRHTRIFQTPHYVVGMSPTAMYDAIDNCDVTNGYIKGETSELVRRKILVEIYFQSIAGKLNCLSVEKPDEYTKQALKAHQTTYEATLAALWQSFGIDPNDKENRLKQLREAVDVFTRENARKDQTFNFIAGRAFHQREEARLRYMARRGGGN